MAKIGKVFVSGATGFIGGRVVERLLADGATPVRAGVRQWSRAARIGRFPVEMAPADLLDASSLKAALDGVQAVIHCAAGPPRVNEEGTGNLLEASRKAGVRRFVHLSTVDVYGRSEGNLDETTPLTYSGAPYGDSKINAEKICRQSGRDLALTILRPSVVYGPFSRNWTIRVAERLVSGKWRAIQGLEGLCNPVYVDDVVSAIRLALQREQPGVDAFNVSSGESLRWVDYFEKLNQTLGLPPLLRQQLLVARSRAVLTAPLRSVGKKAMEARRDLVMKAYSRWSLAKAGAKWAQALLISTPTLRELRLYQRKAVYSIDKAARELGFQPKWPLDCGLRMTLAWLKHHGFVNSVPAPRE